MEGSAGSRPTQTDKTDVPEPIVDDLLLVVPKQRLNGLSETDDVHRSADAIRYGEHNADGAAEFGAQRATNLKSV